jgi:hypothetical protein
VKIRAEKTSAYGKMYHKLLKGGKPVGVGRIGVVTIIIFGLFFKLIRGINFEMDT